MKTKPALRLKCAAVALSLLAVSGFSALAATFTVTNPNDSGPGSLRDAINAAVSGDKINFAPALNGQTITLTSGELLINKILNIQGSGANQLTISGNHASRVFHTVTDVTLSGLTITNGSAADTGGGVWHENGTLTVTKCVILGNAATGANSRGGGVYAGASIIMRDSTVSQNSAANGSGIYNENEYYGGINNNVTMSISRCTIDHNTASVAGGGVYTSSEFFMGDSTVAYNSASTGGGLYLVLPVLYGAYFESCTITGNSANPNLAGGIFAVSDPNAVSVRNSIVAFQQSGGNIVAPSSWSDLGGNIATDDPNLNLDPAGLRFNGGPTKTVALLPGSSAIDAGIPPSFGSSDLGIDGSSLKDQRGSARPIGNAPDVGAYEYNPNSGATVVTNTNDSGPGSLRGAIASAFTGDTITFAPNLGPQISLTTGELLIQKDLTIQGPGAKVLTVSGSSLSRVFRVSGAQLTMSGLTIANGMAPRNGGNSGAGILVNPFVSYILTPGRLALSACTVTGNQAPDYGGLGAGIGIVQGSLVINNCNVSNNRVLSQSDGVGFYGAGIGFRLAEVSIVNTTISGNAGEYGGGIGLRDTDNSFPISISNCTISGNTATFSGGGLYTWAASPVVRSTLVALNSAPAGPDIMTDVNPNIGGNPTVSSAGYNLIGTAVGYVWINGAGDQLGIANPGLQIDANNLPLLKDNGGPTQTIALVQGSPAIDRGFADASLTTDQRGSGFARMIGGAVDVGAFEVQQLPPIAKAKNITVSAGSDCQASITPQQVNNGSAPGTPNDTITLSLDQSGPFAIGTHNVTLTATDSFGYSSSAPAVVTVADTTAPVITPPAPSSATANSQGKAPVPNVLAQTSTTDCSTVTLQQSPAAGTLVGVGVQTITITATDSAHNSSTATTTFTVKAPLPSFTISINPSTVKQGGQITLTVKYSNPASTAQTLTLKFSLTTPKTKTLMLTAPLTLKAGQTGSVNFPLPIAKSTPIGTYSVTLDAFVGTTQVSTSSIQLTVTK